MSDSLKKQTPMIASTVNYFTQSEIRSLLSVIDDEENRLLFLLGLDLGARVSEVADLQWDRINWSNKFVTIHDFKKKGWRTCTLSPASWELLKAKKERTDTRKEKLIFPFCDKTFNRYIKGWALKAGIERRVRWHTLRHTYVIQARRAGRDWNEIAQQTGDTLSTLVQVYGNLSIEDRVDLTDKKPLIEGDEK